MFSVLSQNNVENELLLEQRHASTIRGVLHLKVAGVTDVVETENTPRSLTFPRYFLWRVRIADGSTMMCSKLCDMFTVAKVGDVVSDKINITMAVRPGTASFLNSNNSASRLDTSLDNAGETLQLRKDVKLKIQFIELFSPTTTMIANPPPGGIRDDVKDAKRALNAATRDRTYLDQLFRSNSARIVTRDIRCVVSNVSSASTSGLAKSPSGVKTDPAQAATAPYVDSLSLVPQDTITIFEPVNPPAVESPSSAPAAPVKVVQPTVVPAVVATSPSTQSKGSDKIPSPQGDARAVVVSPPATRNVKFSEVPAHAVDSTISADGSQAIRTTPFWAGFFVGCTFGATIVFFSLRRVLVAEMADHLLSKSRAAIAGRKEKLLAAIAALPPLIAKKKDVIAAQTSITVEVAKVQAKKVATLWADKAKNLAAKWHGPASSVASQPVEVKAPPATTPAVTAPPPAPAGGANASTGQPSKTPAAHQRKYNAH